MDSFNQTDLIVRVLAGDATSEEKAALQEWIASDTDNPRYFKDISAIWEQSAKSSEAKDFPLKQDWQTTLTRIKDVQRQEKLTRTPSVTYQFLRIAATILILISAGYSAYRFYTLSPTIEQLTTLDTKFVTLPDGSSVTLNVHSRLSYPQEFDAKSRQVSLEGEAFFDIKKDPERPFTIKTDNATTEVVGTSFSVDTRSDSVVVTVVTGQVALYEERENAVRLHPGERGIAHRGKVNKAINTDHNFLSWQTNILEFRNATFGSLSKDISRHFKVPVVIQSDKLAACTITARFKDQRLDQVLEELQLLFPISVSTKGDTILIDGRGCDAFNQ